MFLQLLLNVFGFFLNFVFAGILRLDKSVLGVSAVNNLVLPLPCLACPTDCAQMLLERELHACLTFVRGNILTGWLLLSALVFNSHLMHVTNKSVLSAPACGTYFIES